MACQEERAEIAVILVENGANLHIQNKVEDSNHESNRYLSLSHCHILGLYSMFQSTGRAHLYLVNGLRRG